MKMMKKILVATDFDESSTRAARMALMVAKAFGAEIKIVHVLPDLKAYSIEEDTIRVAADRYLVGLKSQLADNGVTIKTDLLMGSPVNEIISEAQNYGANIIMVGAGDKSEADAEQLGTTAGKIMRLSEKPVWAVPKGKDLAITKILCPVDLTPTSERALKNAIHLARDFHAELHVLLVIKPPQAVFRFTDAGNTKARGDWIKLQRENFEKFVKNFDFHNIKWSKEVSEGDPADEILKTASEIGADLMVMGSTGKTGLARLALGSTTEKVLRKMPCPVITLKHEELLSAELEREIRDIENHCEIGHELLEEGYPEKAASEFNYCLNKDLMFAPGWEGLAEVHERLNQPAKAALAREHAQRIRETFWNAQVESEARKLATKKTAS